MAAAWAGADTYLTVARWRSRGRALPRRQSQERTMTSNTPSPGGPAPAAHGEQLVPGHIQLEIVHKKSSFV